MIQRLAQITIILLAVAWALATCTMAREEATSLPPHMDTSDR